MHNAAAPAGGLGPLTGPDALQGFEGGARVLTTDGAIPVSFLMPGDGIVTRDAGVQVLRAVQVACLDAAGAVTIGASALGHARPGAALTVAAGQFVVIHDWRARALYGGASALVAAARLADGRHVAIEPARPRRFYALIFDAPHVVPVEGVDLAMTLTAPGLG